MLMVLLFSYCFFFCFKQKSAYGIYYCLVRAEDGIRDLVRSLGLGDVYKWGFLGIPMDSYGCLGITMDSYGFIWIPMDLSLIHF